MVGFHLNTTFAGLNLCVIINDPKTPKPVLNVDVM